MKQMILDDLLKAIHNSVLKTQQLTEEQYFRVMRRYFNFNEEDRDSPELWGSPKTIKMKLPAVINEEMIYKEVDIPAIALVPPTGIKIKSMKVSFEASLGGFKYEDAKRVKGFSIDSFLSAEEKSKDVEKIKHNGPITLKMGRSLFGDQKAKIEIEFESCEQPETVARINDKIVSKLPF